MFDEFCINDALHLFKIGAVVNLLLYISTCIKFDSRFTRVAYAFDFALFLKFSLETAIGDTYWPQAAHINLFIIFCFGCFFYIMSPNIWGTVFLILGLLAVQGVWDPVREQIYAFFKYSFNITLNATHANVVFASLIVFILFVCAISFVFTVPFVQVTSLALVYGVKAIVAINILRLGNDRICCAPSAPKGQCPIWFQDAEWYGIAIFFIFRLIWGRVTRNLVCSRKNGIKLKKDTVTENQEQIELITKDKTSKGNRDTTH